MADNPGTALAVITYYDAMANVLGVELSTGHRIEIGGPWHRYCYTHQSLDCAEAFTADEWEAINNAKQEEWGPGVNPDTAWWHVDCPDPTPEEDE